jgi:hypothetical protein
MGDAEIFLLNMVFTQEWPDCLHRPGVFFAAIYTQASRPGLCCVALSALFLRYRLRIADWLLMMFFPSTPLILCPFDPLILLASCIDY